ncbi:MAG: hypothetical protein A3G18_03645 [Rhodospirillales bacterium RIFCSPLOWO2_12_FULL_58_28]|nr:MAG: hypothetical protein A3H92_00975 [Rhodospirillales bacterium RIFCSPLOWO2_02_FULL_58_16]OHC76856.1 MAG: hypothetical protein A3G18_03645 [Rhodospirillales bacterium RIFCSPLOWO2_12_FULL_58_28]
MNKPHAVSARQGDMDNHAGNGLYLTIYVLLYFLAFAPMALIQGPLWDDWVWRLSNATSAKMWLDLGRPYHGPVFDALQAMGESFSATRIAVFVIYFISGLLLFRAATVAELASPRNVFWIVLLTILAPVNMARVIEVNLPYPLSFFFYCLSFYFLAGHFAAGRIIARLLSLFFLFLSFATPSFLVLAVVPALFIYYNAVGHIPKWGSLKTDGMKILRCVVRYFDFHAAPVVFFIMKSAFFEPSGIFKNYNVITFKGLLWGTVEAAQTAIYNLYMLFSPAFKELLTPLDSNNVLTEIMAVLLLALLAQAALPRLAGKRRFFAAEDNSCPSLGVLFFGLGLAFALLMLAIYPYVVVKKFPHPIGIASRHQTSLHLFIGAFVFFAVMILARPRIVYGVLALVAGLFTATNCINYVSYLKHSHVQSAIIEEIRKTPEIRAHTTFVFDESRRPNMASGDSSRFPELTHFMAKAFGEHTRLGAPYLDNVLDWRKKTEKYASTFAAYNPNYAYDDYRPDGRIFIVRVEPGNKRLNMMSALTMAYNQRFNKESYAQGLQGLVRLVVNEIITDD